MLNLTSRGSSHTCDVTTRRDWLQTLVSDGFVMLRHPDLGKTIAMADAVGTDLQMYAE